MQKSPTDGSGDRGPAQFFTSTGYSDFWRRDIAGSEAMELAKLLKAIRTVASYVGRNTGQIIWQGMSAEGNPIVLDPGPVLGTYPVPGAKSDVIIGQAVRACFGRIEFSTRLERLAVERTPLAAVYQDKFRSFLETAEMIHADCLSNRNPLGYYTDAARRQQIAHKRSGFITPPTVEELLYIWWEMAAHRSGKKYLEPFQDRSAGGMTERTGLEKFYSKPLDLLNGMVGPLIHACQQIQGKQERVESRLNLYLSIWPELLGFIRFWPAGRDDRFLLGDRYGGETAVQTLKRNALQAAMKRSMKRVETFMQGPIADFTPAVRSVVDDKDEVVTVESDDIVLPSETRVDKTLLGRLRQVLQSVCATETRKIRGLRSGKIDGRRLYRAATTGAVFHLRENHFVLNHDVVLLVDFSGSMDSPQKRSRCEILYQTLFTALQSVSPHVRLFGYNELRDTCRITELVRKGRFHTILPHGKTASGEAIIAVALGILKRRSRSPLLFHITDGASNWGCGVNDALQFCRRKGITPLTLGLECPPAGQADLKKEYGNQVEFVDHPHKIPSIMDRLLRNLK